MATLQKGKKCCSKGNIESTNSHVEKTNKYLIVNNNKKQSTASGILKSAGTTTMIVYENKLT